MHQSLLKKMFPQAWQQANLKEAFFSIVISSSQITPTCAKLTQKLASTDRLTLCLILIKFLAFLIIRPTCKVHQSRDEKVDRIAGYNSSSHFDYFMLRSK